MPNVTFEQKTIELQDGETVLESLIEAGFDIPNACRAGACHSCLMIVTEGTPSESSQDSLKDTQKAQNYFLPCSCVPDNDLTVAMPADEDVRISCEVTGKQELTENILEIRLKPDTKFDYIGGQYVTLWKGHHDGRSCSLASVHGLDDELILHIKEIPGGVLSDWLQESVSVGQKVDIQGPAGDCFYTADDKTAPLLLVGTSTGLAPLVGILRDAVHQGHSGDIHLYHGALDMNGLYLIDELKALSEKHSNVFYHASIVKGDAPGGVALGLIDELVMDLAEDFRNYRVYLCGAPELVESVKKKVFLKGASMKHIFSDAFLPPAK